MPFKPESLLQAYGAEQLSALPKLVHYNKTSHTLTTTANPDQILKHQNEFRQNEFTAHFYHQPFSGQKGENFLKNLDIQLLDYLYTDGTISEQNRNRFFRDTIKTQLQGQILGNSPYMHPNIKAVVEGSKVIDPSRSLNAYERFGKAMKILQLNIKELISEPDLSSKLVSDSLCLLKGLKMETQKPKNGKTS